MSITCARGETYKELLTCRDRRTGERASLVGTTIIATIAPWPGNAPLVELSTLTSGIEFGDQSDPEHVGEATLTWTAEQTAGLTATDYYRDVWLIDAQGNQWVIVRPEPFRIYEPVRRPAAAMRRA